METNDTSTTAKLMMWNKNDLGKTRKWEKKKMTMLTFDKILEHKALCFNHEPSGMVQHCASGKHGFDGAASEKM